MINIAVCEDDIFLGGQIETALCRYADAEGVAIQTEVMTSAEQCLRYIRESNMVDLLFLDIELGAMSGIELAEIIRNELHNDYMQIVYVSSKQSYAMELFESHPLHFLVKPLMLFPTMKEQSAAKNEADNAAQTTTAVPKFKKLLKIVLNDKNIRFTTED